MQASLQGKDNVIRQLKKELSQLQVTRIDTDRALRHYKELYDSIKITRAKHIEQVTKVKTENMNLKTSVSKATVNPLVSARDKHAIDVEPIVPRLRNNWNAHLDYLRHLKESVEMICDIVEEAKVVKPLDRSIIFACRYTKHSQELLEYAIGTCPHGSQPRAKQLAHIPLIKKKQVIVSQPSNMLDSTTHPHVVTVTSQKTNVPVPPSTGVDYCSIASGSQPISHVKPNRISPAKDKMADVNAPSDQTPTMAPPRKHMFHPRPDSPLHLSNEEPVLGYLKFSAKGTKREIFRMPILSKLITANIREAPYYQEYQENVAKHRGFLASETRSTQDLHVPKLAKPARKPQSTAQKAPLKHSISSLVTSTQPAPTSVPAKTQENKRKQATRTTDKPAKPKGLNVVPLAKHTSPEVLQSLWAVEESMKDAYALPKGPLPPVVIREPESGKYQPLPEVPRKGKAKVSDEQVSHDLLSLQKHKKTSPVDQYIFQSEEESEKIVLGVEKGSQDEGQAGPEPNAQAEGQTGSDTSAQAEGQAGSNPDETSEGQAGSNPDETSKGQAGPDPGNAEARLQSTSSPVVHDGSDREHMDLDVANVSPQPSTEQLYEGFTVTVYPNVQENLKLAVKEPVLLEEPASSSETLSSLTETKVESMVNVLIQQALSSISLMTSPIIDLTSRPESPKEHQQLKATTTDTTTTTTTTLPPPQAPQQSTTEAMMVKRINELEHTLADLIQVNKTMEERLDKHGARLYTLEQLNIPQQVNIAVSEVVTDAIDWAMQAPLHNRFRDLPEADMKEILHQFMWESDSYKSHKYHMKLFEALEKSINRDHSEELAHDLAEARKERKKGRESPKTPPGSPSHQPPPPPPPAGPSGTSGAPRASGSQVTPPPPPPTSTNQDSPSKGSAAPSPAKTTATTKHQAWSTPDVTLKPLVSLTFEDLDMDDAMGPDEQVQLSDEEDIGSAHIPTIGDITIFMDWFCKRRGITELKPQDLEGPAYEIVKHGRPHTKAQRQQTTTTGGPPGQVIIQSDFFFNKDLEYMRYGSKGRRPALSILKMKAAYYPDAGLEQMVPDLFWIEEEYKYDIAAMYGISYWWFQRQRFYIDRHTSEGDRSTVRTHMRILSVVRIEVFSMYGYDYMKKIVLRHADLNEHVIVERDFKYLYPSNFKDLNLLNLQGHLNHLPPKDKKILTTATMMRFNEIYKFSDGTLQQIVEALDYRVKEFRINRMNPGLNTRFWTKKDVDRYNAFMFVIQRRLRTRRIFRNVESFVGGRVREGDYRLLKRTN
nr:hypothetical protein [Tanacetum cinerariifolium]